jgi:hypothetical protein
MARRPTSTVKGNDIDESSLTKGQVRKLNALRKSIGEDIGLRAFSEWLSKQSTGVEGETDKNAERIKAALEPLIKSGRLTIPRGGYLVRRGRNRVIVARARES